jgi:drug/metabolite transporter (DMT)-like permease
MSSGQTDRESVLHHDKPVQDKGRMRRPSDVAAYSALTVAAFVWGGSIVAQKVALDAFSAVETSVFRGIGALAILIPLWWRQEGPRAKFTSGDMLVLAALGMGVLGNHLLTLLGLRYIGAAAAGVIIGASPAITAFLSAFLIRDVPFTTVAGGCLLSFAGVALVSGYGGEGAGGANPWIGGVLVLAGLVSWSLYTIGGRRIMERLSPLTVNWTTLLISLVVQIPLLATDHRFLVDGASTVPVSGWIAMIYLIVFATALGQQAWLYGVKGVGPSRAGVFVNLIPVSALSLSALVLGEPIGVKELVGIVLILAGVWLVGRQSARVKPTARQKPA